MCSCDRNDRSYLSAGLWYHAAHLLFNVHSEHLLSNYVYEVFVFIVDLATCYRWVILSSLIEISVILCCICA